MMIDKKTEDVLCIPADVLTHRYLNSKNYPFIEIRENHHDFFNSMIAQSYFYSRERAETDENLKQIIPYAYVVHKKSIFVLERFSTQSESRLHNKLSLGVGGHINKNDKVENGNNIIYNGLYRELKEEIWLEDLTYQMQFKGLINDDSNSVGRVHLGVIFEVALNLAQCHIKEKNKMSGHWMLIEELKMSYQHMETWSQILVDNLLMVKYDKSFD